ncbi:MAG TPA: AarF/UbiB family protein, partial [Candidatus Eisenbacteria bacterium]|nr:AarF/UbiB family protein [Candidatus Eisenbacteria bacterium]
MNRPAATDVRRHLPGPVDEQAATGLLPPQERRADAAGVLLLALHAAARAVRLAILSLVFLPALVVRGRAAPAALRSYLQACGGAFVKLGQALALRYDLLPQEYCDELLKLLDQVPAMPLARIERVIVEDLRRPIASCFSTIDPTPLGSASIAQVHAARLPGGQSVAVKVARPGIARTLRIDLSYLRLAGRLSTRLGLFRRLNLEAVVRQLSQMTWEELDFRREAR